MESHELPSWLPDWTLDDAYPSDYLNWSLTRWCWEFLRRNPEYQADYLKFMSIPSYCRYDGELEHALMNKWRVIHLPDPSDSLGHEVIIFDIDYPPHLFEIPVGLFEIFDCFPVAARAMIDFGEVENVTLRFDVRYGIDRQLEKAKVMLMEHVQNIKSGGNLVRVTSDAPNLTKLPVYLRAYDAFMAGAGPRALAAKICPLKNKDPQSLRSGDAEARRAILAGQALVNMGYVNLFKNQSARSFPPPNFVDDISGDS